MRVSTMFYICFSIQNMACTVNSDVAVQTLDLVKQVRTPPVRPADGVAKVVV